MKAAFDIIAKGGLVMIPLAVCSVLALAVVIERAVAWLRLGGTTDADRVLALAGNGEWDEASRVAQRSRSPVARVLAAGIVHRNPAAGLAMEAPRRTSWRGPAAICHSSTRSSRWPRFSACSGP